VGTPPPPPPPPPLPCALSAASCALGEEFRAAACACAACAGALPEHGEYAAPGRCDWSCAAPFVKLDGRCAGLRRLAPPPAAAPDARELSRPLRGEQIVILVCAVSFLAAVSTFAVIVSRHHFAAQRAPRPVRAVARSKVAGV